MSLLKKSISYLLIVAVLISTFIYSFTTTVTGAAVTTMHITGSSVAVRKGAGTGYAVIERISQQTVTVVDTTPKWDSNKEYQWYNVTYNNGTKQITGWIAYSEDWVGGIYTYDPDAKDADFETKLKAFPKSYHDALKKLHAQYPNWEFIPDTVAVSFNDAVAEQMQSMRKQVQIGASTQPVSWRSMGLGSYDWSKNSWVSTNGGWTGASREVIAYYMDPRNFLDSTSIYMFLEQSYNVAVQNEDGVKKIIAGTFMEKDYTPASGEPGKGSYLKVIMLAAEKSGVSPYIIASKIRQEQGVNGTSPLISGTYKGYEGYYNFFNIGAYSTADASVTVNGLKRAKSSGWDTRYKSILGGSNFLANNYISVGQNTYYYQDFNVHNGGTHQYAQAVHDAYNKGVSLASTYKSDTEFSLSFRIPVYADMPAEPCEMPAKNSKKNNYYLSEISVSGLTPSFNMYTYTYNLQVSGNTTIKVNPVSGATVVANKTVALKKGENTVKIYAKSETGYTNEYVISVNATKKCTLSITSDGSISNNSSSSSNSGSSGSSSGGIPKITLGDTNSDGAIDILDLARVQMHILKLKVLSGNSLSAADTNEDGKVDIIDLAKVQMHILKIKPIEQ